MPRLKPVKAAEDGGSTKQFSLVPALAQRQMYETLSALLKRTTQTASGAEIAEIAACLTVDKNDPVILACAARGARAVRKDANAVEGKLAAALGGVLAAATVTAVAALLKHPEATAVVCAGKLDGADKSDYCGAFRFAARHKLPVLYVVANSYTAGRRQKLDLRTLHAELGIPVFSVDANDAVAAYRVATEALHNARHLRGPCVIEALSVHGARGDEATPLELLRGYMERHGSWPL